jgi:hypothetical protein
VAAGSPSSLFFLTLSPSLSFPPSSRALYLTASAPLLSLTSGDPFLPARAPLLRPPANRGAALLHPPSPACALFLTEAQMVEQGHAAGEEQGSMVVEPTRDGVE